VSAVQGGLKRGWAYGTMANDARRGAFSNGRKKANRNLRLECQSKAASTVAKLNMRAPFRHAAVFARLTILLLAKRLEL
jgi:hypothetical protein